MGRWDIPTGRLGGAAGQPNMEATAEQILALEESWTEHHGRYKLLARTVLMSRGLGPIYVSTVLLAVGIRDPGGPFTLYETRTFGGRLDGEKEWFNCPGRAPGNVQGAMRQHVAAVDKLVESLLV